MWIGAKRERVDLVEYDLQVQGRSRHKHHK